MAYTVWGAFNAFRENTVDLDSNETQKARASRDYLVEQLKRLSRGNPGFPMDTNNYHPFGSFARRTKIRPLDDVDLMILLNGRGTVAQTTSDPYTYWLKIQDGSAPLADFPDNYGYVHSVKILNRIKSQLTTVATYRSAELKRNMQAIILNLVSYPWSFDVVPGVPITNGTGGIAYYLIPDGTGNWMRTDPRIDAANITRVNKRHNGKFLPTVRLLKYWNRRTHKPRLSSYYFETLATQVFEYAPVIVDFPQAVKYFFDNCPTYLWRTCPDPKGLGPNLDTGVDLATKQKVATAMEEGASQAASALRYEGQSNPKDAIYWWRRVFGPDFPEYG